MKAWFVCVLAFIASLIVVTLVSGYLAVWASGDLQERLAGQAVLSGFLAFFGALVTAACIDIFDLPTRKDRR